MSLQKTINGIYNILMLGTGIYLIYKNDSIITDKECLLIRNSTIFTILFNIGNIIFLNKCLNMINYILLGLQIFYYVSTTGYLLDNINNCNNIYKTLTIYLEINYFSIYIILIFNIIMLFRIYKCIRRKDKIRYINLNDIEMNYNNQLNII